MSEKDGGVDLFCNGAKVGVVPGGASLTVDAGDYVVAVRGVPAEAKAVTV